MGGEKSLHKAKYQESSWPRQYHTINTDVLCRTTCPIFVWNLQPFSQPMQSPYLLQVTHHHSYYPPKVSSLNDYRVVAHVTSIAVKLFECLVLSYLKTATDSLLDPHQFTCRANRSVEDAICLCLHLVLKHLDCPNTYARMLFIDYSSVFNTIIPHKLFNKLRQLNVNTQMCMWILDFLFNRTQVVKFNSRLSEPLTLSTGAPQGCVLFPLLFTLFTNVAMTAGPVAAPLWHSSSQMIPPLKDW